MKRVLLSAILSTYLFIGFSQTFSKNYEVQVSDPYDVVDARSKEYFSVEDGNFALTVKSNGATVTVQKMDVAAMKEVKKATIVDFPDKSYAIKTVKIDESNLIYVYTNYDKKTKSFIVNARKINMNDCTMGKAFVLFQTSKKVQASFGLGSFVGTMPVATTGRLAKFDVKTSFDKTKLMVSYRLVPESKRDAINKDVIGMEVYNTSDLSKVWGEEVTMPYTEKDMNNISYGVNNNGKSFILIRKNETNNYAVLQYDKGELDESVLDIKSDLFLQELKIKELPNGNLACVGLYGNGVEFKMSFSGGSFSLNIDGFYGFILDKNLNLLSDNQTEFSIDFIKQYLNERQAKSVEKREEKGKAGIEGLSLENFIIDEKGNFILVCEQQYMANEPWGTSLSENVYHYSNVVLIKTNPKGELTWMKKLPKNQASVKALKGGMGIQYMSDGKSHYVVFLDNKKNAELAPNEVPKAHKDGLGGILTSYRVDDATGDVTKDMIFDVKDVQGIKIYQFTVDRIFSAGNDKLLLEIYLKGKKDGLIKMGFVE